MGWQGEQVGGQGQEQEVVVLWTQGILEEKWMLFLLLLLLDSQLPLVLGQDHWLVQEQQGQQ